MGYFDHPYCSNSALSKLVSRSYLGDPYENYRIGTLIDAVITEPAKLDLIQMRVLDTEYTFSIEELVHAKKMKAAYMADPFCKMLLEASEPQMEVYVDELPIEYMGIKFWLSFKGKFDLPAIRLDIVGDLKSTFAINEKQFREACDEFDYWRQMYVYMKIMGVSKAVIIGVSKKNFKVFKITITKNDPNYLKGKASFEELAFRYWVLN